jgi:glycosyltransferase involved in cell wall biosynthesis
VRKARCEEEARSYNLRNLEFRPPVPKSRLPDVQRDADILVAAITNSESFRFGLNLNKLCSYFASARPVLFSGSPPNDPVSDSGGGVSVKVEDPQAMVDGLKQLAGKSPVERIQMGAFGRRYAETMLSIDVLGAQMEKLLASAISEFPRRT